MVTFTNTICSFEFLATTRWRSRGHRIREPMSVCLCGRCQKGPPNANLVPKIGTARWPSGHLVGHLLIPHSCSNRPEIKQNSSKNSTINLGIGFFEWKEPDFFVGMWPFSIQLYFFVEIVDRVGGSPLALIVIFNASLRLPSVSSEALKRSCLAKGICQFFAYSDF